MKAVMIGLFLLMTSLYSFDYELEKGWNLLGAVEDIENPYESFDSGAIMLYKNDLFLINGINKIDSGLGFWIYSDRDRIVSIGESGTISNEEEEEQKPPMSDSFTSSSDASAEVEDELSSEDDYIISPDRNSCEKSGGIWWSKYNICRGNFKVALEVCEQISAYLVEREDIVEVINECGGSVGDYKNNYKNAEYQKCYKKFGFSPSFVWVDREHGSRSGAFQMQNGTYNLQDKNSNKFDIKCVK